MVRWNYVIPRVALFALFIGFSTLAMNPMVRWGIVRTGQSITGARVDIAKVRSALLKGQVTLDGVQAADPRHPMKNLFEASHLQLNIDTDALKRRRFVITDGQATGFRLGTARNSPGTLDATEKAKYTEALAEQFAASGIQWIRNAEQVINTDVTGSLRSVALSQELAAGWPMEQKRIDDHSTYVRDKIVQIQKLIDESGGNPLRNLQPYKQAIVELESLQKEAFEISGGMNRLRQQLLMDQNTIREAVQQDAADLLQPCKVDELAGGQLSEFLVGPELNDQIREVLDWVCWGRKQIPTGAGIPLSHRGRGEDILFPGISIAPQTVIHNLTFNGRGAFGDEDIEIEGVVRGLSSHPKLAASPVEIAVKSIGNSQITIQASSDLRGDTPHEHILVSCPSLSKPKRILGQSDKLSVAVSPGVAQLWVRVEIVGDVIDGELIVKQRGVELVPTLDPGFAGGRVSSLVTAALSDVDRIETKARLSGTIDQPACHLESTLGPALAAGMAGVVSDAAWQNQQRFLAARFSEIDALVANLDQVYEAKNQELLAQFETRRNQLERIKEIIATRVDRTDGVTDEKSPLRETFRR